MPIQWQTEDGKLFDSTLGAFNHAREAKIRVACRGVCVLQPDTSTTLAEFENLVLELQEYKQTHEFEDVYFNTNGSFLVEKMRIMRDVADSPYFWEVKYWPALDDPKCQYPITCIYTWF